MSQDLVEARGHGVGYVAPLTQSARFSEKISRHHRPFMDDYTMAKLHITQMLGDISDLDIFGRNVLVGVYVRMNTMPIVMPDGSKRELYLSVKEVTEDAYQGKVVLVLKCGPDAFRGEDSYIKAMFDGVPPKPGDWLFANANSGIQVNICGEGMSRPQGVDRRGEPFDLYEWDGWWCRIISDEQFLGRLERPHSVV